MGGGGDISEFCRVIKGNFAASLIFLFPKLLASGRRGGGSGGEVAAAQHQNKFSRQHICHLILCLTIIVRFIFP